VPLRARGKGRGAALSSEPSPNLHPAFTIQAKTIVSLKQLCIQAHAKAHSACRSAYGNP